MTSKATNSVGTKFLKYVSSAWAPIAEVTQIDGPDKSRETIDVTNLDSTEGWKEFIAGFKDGGTVDLTMNFTREGYDLMDDDFNSNTRQSYQILLPDTENTSIEFLGLVVNNSLSIQVGDRIMATVSIKVSGPVTTNSGSA